MKIFLFARVFARAGHIDAVRKAIHDVQGPTRAEAGCLGYHAFQSIRDAHEFFIHSQWVDKAAFDTHVAQQHTLAFVERVQPLIDAPLKPVLTQRLA